MHALSKRAMGDNVVTGIPTKFGKRSSLTRLKYFCTVHIVLEKNMGVEKRYSVKVSRKKLKRIYFVMNVPEGRLDYISAKFAKVKPGQLALCRKYQVGG